MKITILGDGAFGTALAHLVASNGHEVTLWCYNKDVAASIAQERENKIYLPGITLPSRIKPVTELSLYNADWIIEAVPMPFLRDVLCCLEPTDIPWVLTSKGIEQDTLFFASDILLDTLGPTSYVVLSGPSFAREVATGVPTGVLLAGERALEAQQLFDNDYFFTKVAHNPKGLQLCGAFKNLIALALGIVDGAGYGLNTQALVFTKMVQELAIVLQEHKDVLLTLAGIGDLVLSAYAMESRNRALGYKIGQGDYTAMETSLAEGLNTLKSFTEYSKGCNVPTFKALTEVVFEKGSPKLLVSDSAYGR